MRPYGYDDSAGGWRTTLLFRENEFVFRLTRRRDFISTPRRYGIFTIRDEKRLAVNQCLHRTAYKILYDMLPTKIRPQCKSWINYACVSKSTNVIGKNVSYSGRVRRSAGKLYAPGGAVPEARSRVIIFFFAKRKWSTARKSSARTIRVVRRDLGKSDGDRVKSLKTYKKKKKQFTENLARTTTRATADGRLEK